VAEESRCVSVGGACHRSGLGMNCSIRATKGKERSRPR